MKQRILFLIVPGFLLGQSASTSGEFQYPLSFTVASDMQQYAGRFHHEPQFFRGVCEAIAAVGKGAFMVCPGDLDSPEDVNFTIQAILGDYYTWYPVAGNHDVETPSDMKWLRAWGSLPIPGEVSRGPAGTLETTYSVNMGQVHLVIINQYYDGETDWQADGDIHPKILSWLKADLEANSLPIVFIFGHEPLKALPDMDTGRIRHVGDSLDKYPRRTKVFLDVMKDYGVTAYICGHTHNASYFDFDGVWQINTGHAQGIDETETPSTFLKITVEYDSTIIDYYRSDSTGIQYRLTESIVINN